MASAVSSKRPIASEIISSTSEKPCALCKRDARLDFMAQQFRQAIGKDWLMTRRCKSVPYWPVAQVSFASIEVGLTVGVIPCQATWTR